MIDEVDIDIAFTKTSKEPPQGASRTTLSDSMDSIAGWLRHRPVESNQWYWVYCICSKGLFKYFKSESNITPIGVFNFKQLTTTIEARKENQFSFEFHYCNYQFIFKSKSKEERKQWLNCLNINNLIHSPMNEIVFKISRKDSFWKYEKISNLKFVSTANTGDILLFQAKNVGAKIQRTLGGSSFDHAAMLLCLDTGKISVFEANRVNGVVVTDWEEFLKFNWLEIYEKIMYRRLDVEWTQHMLKELEQFVADTEGKKFCFGAKKIVSKGAKKPGEEDEFYSAELIASAYKAVGLLQGEFDTSKVWLSNFEKDNEVSLVGAGLGPLMEIDFDLESMEGV